MRQKSKLLLLLTMLLLLLGVTRTQAQSYAQGRVNDEKGNPLSGASVSEKDRPSNGTTTDSLGRFVLVLKGKSNQIVVNYIGYEDLTVKATNGLSLNLKPARGNTNNEVVVVGYQTQRRRNITGSVATVSGKDLENMPAASFDQLLQGRAAGVSVQSSTGAPGARANIVIRGATNTDYANANGGNNQPLYVIDGVIFDVNNMTSASATGNPLTLLNPNDIESIDILKDASAAAIYGARGGNGVIIVKTRRAQKNAKPQIDISGYVGATVRPNLRKVWTGTLERQLKLGLLESQLPYTDIYNGNIPSALTDSLNPAFNNSVDWQGLVIREQAIVNNQDVYASGFLSGNNSYRIGVNHYSEQGTIRGYSLERVSPTLNLVLNPIRHISILANLILSSEKRDHLVAGTDVFNPNLFNNNNFPSSFAQLSPTLLGLYNNTTANKYDDNKIFTYNANIQVTDTITRDLTATISYGNTNYIDKYAYFSPKELNGIQNTAYDNQNQNPNWNFESNLRYFKTIKDHQFVVLGGYSAYSAQRYYTFSSASGINVSGIYTVQTVPPGSNLNTYTGKEVKNTMSYYGNFQYSYKNRYLLNGSLRRDASSIYSPQYRWGTFSAISGGWIVSDENFMKPLSNVVTFLKLRASYGVTGNDPGSWYSRYQALSPDASYLGATTGTVGNGIYNPGLVGAPVTYNGTSVISPFPYNGWFYTSANKASPSVRWESTPQVDIGGDLNLFNNRINFTVDWYQRDVVNKFLWAIPSDATNGYYFYSGNYANVRNRGLEVSVNTNVFSPKSAFQWNAGFNISFNKNYVTKLPNGGRDLLFGETYFRKLLRLGKPLFTYGMFQVDGVYATDADVPVDPITGKRLTFYGNSVFNAGDEIIKDQNGDYTIDDQDQLALDASPQPKFFGGFNNTFSYKRFSLNVFATYSYGNKVLNGALSDRLNGSANYGSWISVAGPAGFPELVNQFWQAPGDNATYPRLVYPSTQNAYEKDPWNLNRSFFLEDGGFIKLKTATLSYAFTSNVAKKLGLRNLSAYVMGYNLFIIKQAKDIPDPELYDVTTGSVNTVYPTARKYQLGVQIGL